MNLPHSSSLLCVICALLLVLMAAGCDKSEPAAPAAGSSDEAPAAASVPTRPAKADPADWCRGHAIPESMCTKCNPKLVEGYVAAGDWCGEHGFPESACPQCNPLKAPEGAAPAGPVGKASDWCGGHDLPESMCTKCNPELTAKFKESGDWCASHGFPESACPKCNPWQPPATGADHDEHGHGGHGDHEEHGAVPTRPAKADPADWCGGHALPESMCTKCNPELTAKFKESGDWCAEHELPESVCPKCNPMDPPEGHTSLPFEEGTKVRLKKGQHEATVGIATAPAKVAPMGLGVQAPARVEFDQNKVASVRAPVAGIVQEVLVDLGQSVEQGDPMFVLASAEVGDLQAGLQSAREAVETAEANLARQKRLLSDGIAPARKVELARQEVEAARSRLLSRKSSLRLAGAGGGSSSGRFTVRAPRAGVVVERPVVVGASAADATPLATVADASAMWAIVDVPEREAHLIAVDQAVSLAIDGLDEGFEGQVTWISPVVDPRTRTVKVRAEIPNPKGRLRANQFATADIGVAAANAGVVVPRGAVQRLDDASVVFVRTGEAVYEPRAVEVGRSSGDRVQVRGDLGAGDEVVTTGAFLLKTELKRDSIGAGCCEVPEG